MEGIEIRDYGRGEVPDGEKRWTTEEMMAEFEAIGFLAPFIVVVRRSDGAKGTLEFTHSPRVYFNFTEV